MTATQVLREQVKNNIDNADLKSLKMVQAILEHGDEGDWWNALPLAVKKSVMKAIKELDEGKGIPHEKVKEMYPQLFKR